MKSRILGRTGQDVSEIGFGAWGIGGDMWGPTDDETSLKALRAGFEHGITFFDTAYVYGDGRSERLIARACRDTGARPFIATKCPPKNWRWPADHKSKAEDAFPSDWIRMATERSLANLETDCLDLQQFHVWSDAWVGRGDWRRTVESLKEEGKIRFFGVSINDCEPESALKLVASGVVDTVQVIYNVFEQAPAKELFPLCRKHGVGVIVRVPFDEGSLAGGLRAGMKFEPGDFRGRYFAGSRLDETVERVKALEEFLGPHAPDLASLALKFVLADEAVSTVIPGMRRPRHVELNCAASDGKGLPKNTLAALSGHAWARNFY